MELHSRYTGLSKTSFYDQKGTHIHNNTNKRLCTKYGILTSFVRKERDDKGKHMRSILRSEENKSQIQKDGNPVDFLWYTCSNVIIIIIHTNSFESFESIKKMHTR